MKKKKKGKSTGKKYGEKTLIGRNPLLPVVHACTRGNTFGVTSLPVGLSVMHNGRVKKQLAVRRDIHVTEHERLSNITLRHKCK